MVFSVTVLYGAKFKSFTIRILSIQESVFNEGYMLNKPIQDGGDADAPLWPNSLSGTDY